MSLCLHQSAVSEPDGVASYTIANFKISHPFQRLKSAKDLIRETKRLSKNGTAVIGQMATTVFVVDAKSGAIIRTVRFSDSSGLGSEDGENPIMLRDESKEQISITRTDYSFLAYSKLSGKQLWNVSLAEFEAESFCPKVDSSIWGDLQDHMSYVYEGKSETCEPCQRRTMVYRIRDREYSELVFGAALPGGKMLQLPGPDHLHFPVPVGEIPDVHYDLDQVLALPHDGTHSFAQSEVLALPSSAHHTGSTMYPESSIKHLPWSPILSGVSVFIVVCYAINERFFSRGNKQQGDLKPKAEPSKKKKSRKSGISKNNTNIDDTKGRISKADGGFLAVNDDVLEKKSNSSFAGLVNVQVDGRMIGKLYVSNSEIAKGSNGTVVFEGTYDGRPVAVKRLVRTHHDVALKEIQNLVASDQHLNIVRFYGVEFDADFVYLSLERCLCSLNDLIYFYSEISQGAASTKDGDFGSISGPTAQLLGKVETNNDFDLWKTNGYPSHQLLRVMRLVMIPHFSTTSYAGL